MRKKVAKVAALRNQTTKTERMTIIKHFQREKKSSVTVLLKTNNNSKTLLKKVVETNYLLTLTKNEDFPST